MPRAYKLSLPVNPSSLRQVIDDLQEAQRDLDRVPETVSAGPDRLTQLQRLLQLQRQLDEEIAWEVHRARQIGRRSASWRLIAEAFEMPLGTVYRRWRKPPAR